MSEKKPERIRLFSYTSSGTRLLTSGLHHCDVSLYREGGGHTHLSRLKPSYALQPQDKPIIIYGDPRLSFLSLTMKRLPRRFHGCRMAKGMGHLGMSRHRIRPLYDNPFLPWANDAEPTSRLKNGINSPPLSTETRDLWTQFDGIQSFFYSWFVPTVDAPCAVAFIKYEFLREQTVIKDLAAFLERDEISEPLCQFLNSGWTPRATSLEDLEMSRRRFLDDHFEDLLDVQSQLPPFYIAEKK